MTSLSYCQLEIFGSNFDVNGFASQLDAQSGTVFFPKSTEGKPKSPIKAIQLGNVAYWKSKKRIYSSSCIESMDAFSEICYEEEFLINFLNDHTYLMPMLKPFRSDSTEIWLLIIYTASRKDSPRGVYFGKNLIETLSRIGCSISTDVHYID